MPPHATHARRLDALLLVMRAFLWRVVESVRDADVGLHAASCGLLAQQARDVHRLLDLDLFVVTGWGSAGWDQADDE